MRRAAVTGTIGVAAAMAGAAALVRRRSGSPAPGAEVHALTILAPVDAVRTAWEGDADRDGEQAHLDLRPAPGDRGTEVRVTARDAEGSPHGPELRAELRRLKSRLECGAVATTEGQPTGRTGLQEAATRAVTDRLRSWSPA